MLLSPYPRQGASILGLIDATFEKFLPESALDATELTKLFTYDHWRMKLPERVRVAPPATTGLIELPEPKVKVPVTPTPLQTRPAPAIVPPAPKATVAPIVTPSPKPVAAPATNLRIGGGVGPSLPTSAAPASYPSAPKPSVQPSKPISSPPLTSLRESKARPLSDILGNFMRPDSPDAKPITIRPREEEPEESEEPILSSGVSESTLSVIDKLRQRRAALADVIEKGAEEEAETKPTTTSSKPASAGRSVAAPAPTSLFTSPKEWFDAKAKKSFYFTKFAFRLTPDEKKYKEYVTGVGEFAPKNFVLRSAVLEVKVRLMKDESEAINIFWDWLKRGIIDEEKKVGEADEI